MKDVLLAIIIVPFAIIARLVLMLMLVVFFLLAVALAVPAWIMDLAINNPEGKCPCLSVVTAPVAWLDSRLFGL